LLVAFIFYECSNIRTNTAGCAYDLKSRKYQWWTV
jgi:hypothetical protein